jgi:hypothetical protein
MYVNYCPQCTGQFMSLFFPRFPVPEFQRDSDVVCKSQAHQSAMPLLQMSSFHAI